MTHILLKAMISFLFLNENVFILKIVHMCAIDKKSSLVQVVWFGACRHDLNQS